MQPDHRKPPVVPLAFRIPFRAVCGSIPRLCAPWRFAPVLFFLIAAPVFAQGESAPPAPEGLGATSGDGEVTLEWTDPRDDAITGYQVRFWETGADRPAWSDDSVLEIGATTTHTVVDLMSGTRYTFEVRAVAGEVPGASDSVTVRTEPPPEPPVELEAIALDRMVWLRWVAAEDPRVTGYQVRYWETGRLMPEWSDYHNIDSDANTMEHPVEGLWNGIEYTFEVRATRGSVQGLPAIVTATPRPDPPRRLLATPGDRVATLEWTDPRDDAITGYQVRYWETGTSMPEWSHDHYVDRDANKTEHTVVGLRNGKEYTIEVRAMAGEVPGASARVTVMLPSPPPAPEDLGATSGDGEVTLEWTDPRDDAITGYQVRFWETGADRPAWSDDSVLEIGATTIYTVVDLMSGTRYTFEVRAVAGEVPGASDSVTVRTAPPPEPPVELEAIALDRMVWLRWVAAEDPRVTGYQVRYWETGRLMPEWSDYHNIDSDANTTEHPVEGLWNGIEYTFEVRAIRGSVQGLPAIVTATPRPDPPRRLLATPGDRVVTLEWTDPRDDAITGYQVRYWETGTSMPEWSHDHYVDSPANKTEHTVVGLRNGKEYTIEVRAMAEEVPGASARVRVRMPPAQPKRLRASPGLTEVTLTWSDPEDASITGYEIRYGVAGADRPAWSDDSVVEIGANTTHTVEDLMIGTRYTFEVRAVAGEVPGASDSVTVRTEPPPPANLRGTVADGIVVLTWDAPALAAGSVTGYQVLWRFPGDNAEGGFRVLAATGAMVRTYTDEDVGFDDSIIYQVKAMYGETLSRGSAEVLVYVPAPPPRPEGLMATAGDGEVTLTWDVPGDHAITGYLVRYRTRVSGTLGSIVEDDVASGERTMTRTVEDLTNEVEYTFEVQLRNAGGYSEASRATATPGARPAAPGNLTALPGDGEVTLSWRDPENPYITRYQVRWAESSMALPEWSDAHIIGDSGPATTEHIVEGLNNGRKYTFEVRARVDDVEGLSASVMATLPPPAPDGLEAMAGDGVATLSWRDPENPYITRYQVRWAESSMALPEWSDAHIIDDSGPATTEHIVEGLNNGRKYTFEVRARVDDVEGLSASVTAVPVPDPPVWVGSPVVGDGAVTLTWEDPEDNAVTAYQHRHTVSRGTDQPDWMGVSWTTIADAGVRDLTVTGLTNGVEYTIQVRAVAGDYPGKTASVTVMLDVPPPAAPDNLTASAGDRVVTLTWDNLDAPDVTGYEIRYGVGEAPAEWTVISVSPEPGASTTTREVPGLTNGVEYTFQVRAIRGSVQGLPARVRATPDLPPPRNLNADLVDGAVALTWDAAATDAASITGYRILRRRPDVDAEVDFHPIGATGATETRYVDAGVEAGHRYAYQVKTQRDNYLSGSSNVASIDVPAPPPPPGNLLAREDDGMVTLTWTDPGDDAVTGYQVRYGDDPTSLPESWHDIAVTTTHEVPGLTNGIEYTFEVRAMRGSVQGLPASVRATPGNRAPANLEAAVDNGAVALTWEAPTADVASVTSYHFHYSLSSDGVNVMRHGTFGTPDADTRTVDTIARERGYPYIAYKVRAKRGEEFSDWSNTVTVMFHDGPPPPEGLTAAAGVGQVTLTWDDAG